MQAELRNTLKIHQKLKVTVWHPSDDTVEYTFSSVILDFQSSKILIAGPAETEVTALMQPETLIGIVVNDKTPHPVIFYPMVERPVTKHQGKPLAGYWIRLPENCQVEVVQRRQYVRVPMTIPIQVTEPNKRPLAASTLDISGSGLRFQSVGKYTPGTTLELQIQFSEQQPPLQLKAKVVSSQENPNRWQSQLHYVTACHFEGLDEQAEQQLVRECFRRELGLKG